MEIFSALLAICVGNSPVTSEFLSQSPVTQSFDVFFDLRLNERLSKLRPSRPLWRHNNDLKQCAVNVKLNEYNHTFYGVIPYLYIIYGIRNGRFYWLLLVSVGFIRQATASYWIAFCELLFLFSNMNTCLKWILCMTTLITYGMYLFLVSPGMTPSVKSHGSLNEITQHVFLKFISFTVTWWNKIQL